MATAAPTVSSTIKQQATTLLENAKQFCNNDTDIEQAYVFIAVLKGTQKVLNDLCIKEISDKSKRTDIEGILKKAQNKLQRAEQLNTFFRNEPVADIDPRVQRIMGKISEYNNSSHSRFDDTPIHEKLTKWDIILKTCSFVSNEPTKQVVQSGRSSISKIDMELLQNAPHIVTFNHAFLGKISDGYYQSQANREECKKMASAFYAKLYLSLVALGLDNHRFDNDGIGEGCDELAHQSTADYLQTHGFADGISAESLFPGTTTEYLEALPFPPSFSCKEIAFPSNANVDEIQKQIDNLIGLKNAHHLSRISAFIEIKPQMLAIVLHPSGRISLVHPCGSKANPKSYEANFANSKQAADFLKNLIAEMGTNQRVVFKPYCQAGVMPAVAPEPIQVTTEIDFTVDPFIDTTSSSSSSSSSSSRSQSNHPTIQYTTQHRSLQKIQPDFYQLQLLTLACKSKEGFSLVKRSSEPLASLKGNLSTSILDRVCFHLYHIQDKETPTKVNRGDYNWGLTAFNNEALATPEQRLRATQRVQVEMLFDYIEVAIQLGQGFDEGKTIDLYFNALEELKLEPNDCPKEQTNAAYALFAKLYTTYVEARKYDPSMEDPHDGKFRGDFGRNAFRGDVAANIPDAIKLEALHEVAAAFKAAWRI